MNILVGRNFKVRKPYCHGKKISLRDANHSSINNAKLETYLIIRLIKFWNVQYSGKFLRSKTFAE